MFIHFYVFTLCTVQCCYLLTLTLFAQAKNKILNRSLSFFLEVSFEKTKVMVVRKNKQQSHAKNGNKRLWKVGNKDIKECYSYKYLGVMLKSNASFSEHIDIV